MKTGGYGPFFPFKIEMGSIEKLGCKGKNRRKSQTKIRQKAYGEYKGESRASRKKTGA